MFFPLLISSIKHVFLILFIFTSMGTTVTVYPMSMCLHRGEQRKLDLHVVVNYKAWVLGAEVWSSEREAHAFNC